MFKRVTGRKLSGLLIHTQNISSLSSGMRRKQNLDNSLLLSLSLPPCFPFAAYLVGFILVGNIFGKTFKNLGLDETKSR